MTDVVHLTCPVVDSLQLRSLRAGMAVRLSGTLLTARDAAHARLHQLLQASQALPVNLENQALYYVGPAPAAPGLVVGAAGPTTASRMDPYTPELLAQGLKVTIGKGYRSAAVVSAMVRHQAVYLGAIGGIGALLSRTIKNARVLAFEDLGPEAIYELVVEDFPALVLVDTTGQDYYQIGQDSYRRRR